MSDINEGISKNTVLTSNTDIFIKQMDLIWGLMKHVSFVSAATYIAWYLLIKEHEYFLSLLALMLSCLVMTSLLVTIRRQTQLQLNYGRKIIRKLGKAPTPPNNHSIIDNISKKIFDSRASAAILARFIPTLILISYHILFYLTFWRWLEVMCLVPTLGLIANLTISFIFIIKFKYIIAQLTKY